VRWVRGKAPLLSDLAMLADSEIRTKLVQLMKQLSDAGVFNGRPGGSSADVLSNVMNLLTAPSRKSKAAGETNDKSLPKYDLSYDATTNQSKVNTNKNDAGRWSDTLKKLFK
jgi:hypothetical protein